MPDLAPNELSTRLTSCFDENPFRSITVSFVIRINVAALLGKNPTVNEITEFGDYILQEIQLFERMQADVYGFDANYYMFRFTTTDCVPASYLLDSAQVSLEAALRSFLEFIGG